jgi:hypothetical protein
LREPEKLFQPRAAVPRHARAAVRAVEIGKAARFNMNGKISSNADGYMAQPR